MRNLPEFFFFGFIFAAAAVTVHCAVSVGFGSILPVGF
jgi:hypothetical protein